MKIMPNDNNLSVHEKELIKTVLLEKGIDAAFEIAEKILELKKGYATKIISLLEGYVDKEQLLPLNSFCIKKLRSILDCIMLELDIKAKSLQQTAESIAKLIQHFSAMDSSEF